MHYLSSAAELWPILTRLASERRTETYGAVGREIGLIARGVSGALTPIHAYCERNDLPLLTALVVRADTRRPGEGYQSPVDHIAECHMVYGYDWTKVTPPTGEEFRASIDLG